MKENDEQESQNSPEDIIESAFDLIDEYNLEENMQRVGYTEADLLEMVNTMFGGMRYREQKPKDPLKERIFRRLKSLLSLPEDKKDEKWEYLVDELTDILNKLN